jgi:hypothetical protein
MVGSCRLPHLVTLAGNEGTSDTPVRQHPCWFPQLPAKQPMSRGEAPLGAGLSPVAMGKRSQQMVWDLLDRTICLLHDVIFGGSWTLIALCMVSTSTAMALSVDALNWLFGSGYLLYACQVLPANIPQLGQDLHLLLLVC